MTLYEIVDILKKIALYQPNIRSASDGSVYDKMNTNPSVQYDVFHISQTNHQEDFETDYYGLQLFYISRLEDSLEDNRLQIQSIGKEILGNVIRTFCENFAIDYPTITYIPFTQKFNDLTAGVYCNVRLEIPKDLVCADDYLAEVVPGSGLKLQDIGITITENGLRVITADAEYDGIGEIRIETNVPQSTAELQYKEVEYTENGEYTVRPDQDYDGLTEVAVSVDVPDRYEEGYDDGKEDGIAEQKGKLVVTSFTENDTYTRADGWSAVTVNVPQTGSTINNQEKLILFSTNPADYNLTWMPNLQAYVTNSPVRVSADTGYTGIEPAVVDIYQPATEAIALGEQNQKAKMVATAITENGEYNREDGYSAVTVNVPSDYQDGYDDGFNDGEVAQKAKMVATAITENGEYGRPDGYSAITVNVPQTGSSNADLIANLQGDYYVIPDGTDHLRQWAFYNTCFSSITIPNTVRIINAYAFANNTCLTSMTFPSSVTAIGSYVLCGDTALEEITFEGTTPPTLGNTGNSLGSTAYTFPIYVPCQSIDAYKTAFGSSYSPRIRCKSSELITAITLNVASAITDSATATTTYSPSTAYTDIYYTSSDTNIATINSATGVISAKTSGTVTICTKDRLSGLQDCKSVSVTKSPTPATSISINVPNTVTDSATATTTVTPSSAVTNLRYSSSDTSKATINATTGAISVKANGTVQFCVTDTISSFQSCKTVTVVKSPVPATSITINVPTTVTDSATATTTVNPSSADTNITYTSSDTSKATINATTGAITVISTGSVTFCVTDNISALQSCKTVTLKLSEYYLRTPLTFEILTGGNIYFAATDSSFTPTIQYRKNNGSWTDITSSTGAGTTISTTAGDIIQFKGCLSSTYEDTSKYVFLSSYNQLTDTRGSARYNIYGNIMSLVACNETTYANIKTLPSNNTFGFVFRKGGVISAENLRLPATTLKYGCYNFMFAGCQNLTTPPQLPATTLAGYCYYGMFNGCTNLTTAPELPATTLAYACYYAMFVDCTNLVKAPDLPALTLVEWCYHNLFTDCTKLNSVKCLATDISAFESLTYWLTNVSNTGTFIKNPSMTDWPIGGTFGEGVPEGWTIIDNT